MFEMNEVAILSSEQIGVCPPGAQVCASVPRTSKRDLPHRIGLLTEHSL